MLTIKKRKYFLKNLNCANCASKIEERVAKIAGVHETVLNFIDKTIKVEAPDEAHDKILMQIKEIVSELEPDVAVLCIEDSAAKKADSIGNKVCLKKKAACGEDCCGTTGGRICGDFDSGCNEECGCGHNHHDDDSTHEMDHEHDHGHSHSSEEGQTKILIIRIILSVILFALSFGQESRPELQLSLYFLSYVIAAYPMFKNSFRNILKLNVFDENFLMVIATCGAFAIKEYEEAIGVMIFFQIGELLQEYAVDHSRKSIRELMNIRSEYVNLKKENGDTMKIDPAEAEIDDVFVVKPGERVPLDGKIINGFSTIDTSSLTGETKPVSVAKDDEVLSGTINLSGVLEVVVTKIFSESVAAKILSLIEDSAAKKARTEQFITKFARVYTPFVVVVAALLCLVPSLVLGYNFSEWFRRSLIFLVISCPCALVVSIPLGFFGGIGGASKKGILIKGANHLEALNGIKTLIFDKTGTITKGNFKVIKVITEIPSEYLEHDLLKIAAACEVHSSHPIAKAILNAYGGDIDKNGFTITDYEEIRGIGIKAKINGANVFVGNDKFLHDENIPHGVCFGAGTTVHLAIDSRYVGHIVIADELREQAVEMISGIKKMGILPVMLTGDNQETANNIAAAAGIEKYYAELLPHEKVEKFEEFQKESSGMTVFLGDGMNDAPVIARADVGIAMGGVGSDAAIEAADIVIMNDNPAKILDAIKIAAKTRKIVIQNIILAISVKGVVLVLGAFGIANMWQAVFADVGVAIIAIFNSIRTMR
ncbi:MAG: heavy metal translocating P-type ATPase [Candidatus Wallbacteria bacterium]